MSLARLIEVLDAAGVDVDAAAVLDALWLATHRPELPATPLDPLPVQRQDARTLEDSASPPQSPMARPAPVGDALVQPFRRPAGRQLNVPLLPGGRRGAGGLRASPIATGAAAVLPDRLALGRALRPFRQRWPSASRIEVDEEATAQLTAELRATGRTTLMPVFRPVPERWFSVELVVEDDDAIDLWRDGLRAFAQVMRDTGAFRQVREWRLRIDPDPSRHHAVLEAPSGARLSLDALHGAERRLFLFASHGASRHWRSDAYRRVLAHWDQDAPVALLHLLPRSAWVRTPLGEARGTASTVRPGVPNSQLAMQARSWRLSSAMLAAATALPMVELAPEAIARWAAMTMGRGRSSPMIPLITPSGPLPELRPEPDLEMSQDLAERRVAALRQSSPAAFELAVLLTTGPFTVPVVRLIQEAHFGRGDQRQLADLFLSGLLRSLRQVQGAQGAGWFELKPAGAALLGRSLRGQDADAVAAALVARVSAHLEAITGRQTELTSFTPDEHGEFALPDWAVPFAEVASRSRAGAAPPRDPEALVARLRASMTPFDFGRCAQRAHRELRRGELATCWDTLLESGATFLGENGQRRFLPEVAAVLDGLLGKQPLMGVRILWVDDVPTNNAAIIRRMTGQGAEVVEVLSTADAAERLAETFDVIISDMGRREGPREGIALLSRLAERAYPARTIIFAGGYAAAASRRREAREAGAYACTNDPRELYGHVMRLVRQPGAPPPPDVGDDDGFDPDPRSAESIAAANRTAIVQLRGEAISLGFEIADGLVLTAIPSHETGLFGSRVTCRFPDADDRSRSARAWQVVWSSDALGLAVIEAEGRRSHPGLEVASLPSGMGEGRRLEAITFSHDPVKPSADPVPGSSMVWDTSWRLSSRRPGPHGFLEGRVPEHVRPLPGTPVVRDGKLLAMIVGATEAGMNLAVVVQDVVNDPGFPADLRGARPSPGAVTKVAAFAHLPRLGRLSELAVFRSGLAKGQNVWIVAYGHEDAPDQLIRGMEREYDVRSSAPASIVGIQPGPIAAIQEELAAILAIPLPPKADIDLVDLFHRARRNPHVPQGFSLDLEDDWTQRSLDQARDLLQAWPPGDPKSDAPLLVIQLNEDGFIKGRRSAGSRPVPFARMISGLAEARQDAAVLELAPVHVEDVRAWLGELGIVYGEADVSGLESALLDTIGHAQTVALFPLIQAVHAYFSGMGSEA